MFKYDSNKFIFLRSIQHFSMLFFFVSCSNLVKQCTLVFNHLHLKKEMLTKLIKIYLPKMFSSSNITLKKKFFNKIENRKIIWKYSYIFLLPDPESDFPPVIPKNDSKEGTKFLEK